MKNSVQHTPARAARRSLDVLCLVALTLTACASPNIPPSGNPTVAALGLTQVTLLPAGATQPPLTPQDIPPTRPIATASPAKVISLPIVQNQATPSAPPAANPTVGISLPLVIGPATPPAPPSASPTESISLPIVQVPASTPTLRTAQQLPDPHGAQWKLVVPGLSDAVGLANAGDGSGRLFVLIRSGVIRVIEAGQLVPAPFLDITGRVYSRGSEQGLLGIAFHPQYTRNGFFYVNYINLNGDTVIARYHVGPNPDQADPNSEQVVLNVRQPFPNHNGGSLAFGPDGDLYAGLGDGGSEGDPQNNGQSTQTLLGKLLRINVNSGSPYTIPADNPFANGGGKPEIWAYGLRNPWRFAFDAQTHDLYIADVGQDTFEEIDYLPAGTPGGTNFGWRLREGMHEYGGPAPAGVKLVDPVFEYTHSQGGCSVTGGYVYRGRALTGWQGVYLFGDYCSGKVWGLLHKPDGSWDGQELFQTGSAITSFGVDEQGEIYLVDQRSGIYQLTPQ